jgi:hypothetical protein
MAIWYIFPLLVSCIKKNLETLLGRGASLSQLKGVYQWRDKIFLAATQNHFPLLEAIETIKKLRLKSIPRPSRSTIVSLHTVTK